MGHKERGYQGFHFKGLIEYFLGEVDDFVGGMVESDDDNEPNVSESDYPSMNNDVRVFLKSKSNLKELKKVISRVCKPKSLAFLAI